MAAGAALALGACVAGPAGPQEPVAHVVAGGDGVPTMETTGPRVPLDSLEPSAALESDHDGQVFERLTIESRLRITHDDVVVRDVRITHDATRPGQYALLIEPDASGACPTGVRVERIEVVGDTSRLVDDAKAVYAQCPFTMQDSRIYDVGSAIRITNGATLVGNYIVANLSSPGSDSHRSGIGLNGGGGHVITGNSIECAGPGCSGALVMYGTNAQVRDVLVQDNLFNTTGSYCTYAGSLDSKPFPVGENIRYVDNVFGQKYFQTCGRYGASAGRGSGGGPGFVWEGNTWSDDGSTVE